MRDYAKSETRLRRAASVAVGRVADYNECPGWKRACGVRTPRELCYYCDKSRSLDQQKESR